MDGIQKEKQQQQQQSHSPFDFALRMKKQNRKCFSCTFSKDIQFKHPARKQASKSILQVKCIAYLNPKWKWEQKRSWVDAIRTVWWLLAVKSKERTYSLLCSVRVLILLHNGTYAVHMWNVDFVLLPYPLQVFQKWICFHFLL